MKVNKLATGFFAGALFVPGLSYGALLPSSGYVTYGDANSYSLPILQEFVATESPGPGNPYYVQSTPGAIKDLVVVATGSGGTGVTTNFDGMDKAYDTPNGKTGPNKDASFYTTTDTSNDPGPSSNVDINNNYDTSWDASLASMNTFLSGEDMVVYFNNNQVKNLDTAGESLAAWAQLWVTDASGNLAGEVYEFTNNNGAYNLFPLGGGDADGDVTAYSSGVVDPLANNPDLGDNDNTDYVLSGGNVLGIDHNLGANEAAYALMFPELNILFAGLFDTKTVSELALYTFHIDFRLGCDPGFSTDPDDEICSGAISGYGKNLNNGYEQIFIGTQERLGVYVPEPGTALLFGLGLAGLGYGRRRSSK